MLVSTLTTTTVVLSIECRFPNETTPPVRGNIYSGAVCAYGVGMVTLNVAVWLTFADMVEDKIGAEAARIHASARAAYDTVVRFAGTDAADTGRAARST